MYQDRLVVAVKHNGKVLREIKQPGSDLTDTVLVPFGAEYSLHFKNLNAVRALVRVAIDGQDATKGASLILPANGSVDLERFLEAGQMDKGHRFKFIERTKKIEDGPRGIHAEDGLIRIEFEFEKLMPAFDPWNEYLTQTKTHLFNQRTVGSPLRGVHLKGGTGTPPATPYEVFASTAIAQVATNTAANEVGITVPGSVSTQKFQRGAWFQTEGTTHVMVIRLLGQVGNSRIEKAVTVKTKQECPTCGTKNRSGTKFCRECGTGLIQL